MRTYPIEASDQAPVPHLPDGPARGIALRDLPGTPEGTLGVVGPDAALSWAPLDGAGAGAAARDGSVTVVGFGPDNWRQRVPLRVRLVDRSTGEQPSWDAVSRALTVPVPRGQTVVVPLSSYASRRPAVDGGLAVDPRGDRLA